MMGLWNSHTSVGNIAGSVVAGAFVEHDWALSFIVPGIIIILMSLPVLFFFVPRTFRYQQLLWLFLNSATTEVILVDVVQQEKQLCCVCLYF